MGNKNIIFFTLWIILGKFCATFSFDFPFDLETTAGVELGEFAAEGTPAPFTHAIDVDMHRQVGENLSCCVYVLTVWARRSASH